MGYRFPLTITLPSSRISNRVSRNPHRCPHSSPSRESEEITLPGPCAPSEPPSPGPCAPSEPPSPGPGASPPARPFPGRPGPSARSCPCSRPFLGPPGSCPFILNGPPGPRTPSELPSLADPTPADFPSTRPSVPPFKAPASPPGPILPSPAILPPVPAEHSMCIGKRTGNKRGEQRQLQTESRPADNLRQLMRRTLLIAAVAS